MPDPHRVVQYLSGEREQEAKIEEAAKQSKGRSMFLILTAQAMIATTGIALIFWESYREWDGLPSISGSGGFLYFLMAVGIALLWTGALYGLYKWRQPE